MSTLKQIKEPVEEHIKNFEVHFNASLKSQVGLLDKITKYIVKRKGKQIRPLYVFFSAGIFGEISERTYRAATLIELLHTATLIHDDVVDDSNERRGFFSLNALWKNKISVLVGDYLLSRGLLLSLDHKDFDLLQIVTESVREMSEGELMQIEKARSLDISEDIYLEIIRKKTASLISSCLSSGAASVGASQENIRKMHLIGEKAGIAFQIKDDILDFDDSATKGKPTGTDIKERKMTLPLIYLINNSSYMERRRIIKTVKNHSHDSQKVSSLIEMVHKKGGIEYATQRMNTYKSEALRLLDELPKTTGRNSLEQLIEFTVSRNS